MRKFALSALLTCLTAVFFCACKKGTVTKTQLPVADSSMVDTSVPLPPQSNLPILIETKKIWVGYNYSAFTDLVFFKSKWYCVFREAESHVGTTGHIRIIESKDGITWTSNNTISISGQDLRDPKFAVLPTDELIVYGTYVSYTAQKITNYYWKLVDGKWSNGISFGATDDWLWQIAFYNKQMFSLGYNIFNPSKGFGSLTLFNAKSADITVMDIAKALTNIKGCATEASFVFMQDGTIIAIARRDCGDYNSYLGVSAPPYNEFTWSDLGIRFQSPKLLIFNNVIYAAGRVWGPRRTAVYTLNLSKKQLVPYVNLLPGNDVDTGYPGLVVNNNNLYVSYYSLDSSNYRSIYLAKLRLKSTAD